MKIIITAFAFTLSFLVTLIPLGSAQLTSKLAFSLPDDPDKAWADVEKVHMALRPPDDWRNHAPKPAEVEKFAIQLRSGARSFANKALEFIQRFPTNENISDARITVVHSLCQAVAAGDTNAEAEIKAYVGSVLADKNISEDDRAGVFLYAGNVAAMKKFGLRIFTEGYEKLGNEIQAAGLDAMHAALKLFPTNAFLYTMMLGAAQEDKANIEIAREVLQSPNAPAEAKKLAQHLVDGTKPYEVGKPLEIKFTALDGRAVDLAKLTGKIVLVEFWSTTCGPCVGRMPEVKSAYEKFHSKGLEIVAISLDDKETALRRFIKEKELPWPQYFDGKGWGNKFALQYGIFSIPTMWLVDKQGHLRDTEAENQLEQRISRLLQE